MRFAEDAIRAKAFGFEAGGAGLDAVFFGETIGGDDDAVAAPAATDPDGATFQLGVERDLATGEEGISVDVQNAIGPRRTGHKYLFNREIRECDGGKPYLTPSLSLPTDGPEREKIISWAARQHRPTGIGHGNGSVTGVHEELFTKAKVEIRKAETLKSWGHSTFNAQHPIGSRGRSPHQRKQRSRRGASCRFMTSRRVVLRLEHDVVGEEGDPLKGGKIIGVGAADEFVLTVRQPDEFALTKLADQVAAVSAPHANGPRFETGKVRLE